MHHVKCSQGRTLMTSSMKDRTSDPMFLQSSAVLWCCVCKIAILPWELGDVINCSPTSNKDICRWMYQLSCSLMLIYIYVTYTNDPQCRTPLHIYRGTHKSPLHHCKAWHYKEVVFTTCTLPHKVICNIKWLLVHCIQLKPTATIHVLSVLIIKLWNNTKYHVQRKKTNLKKLYFDF